MRKITIKIPGWAIVIGAIILIILTIGLTATFTRASGRFNLPLSWILSPSGVSVDLDNNGIVDSAEDADTVDGIHAATSPTANQLLALNGNSKLPASITGDADTVDGSHAAAFQKDLTTNDCTADHYVRGVADDGTVTCEAIHACSISCTKVEVYATKDAVATCPGGSTLTGGGCRGNVGGDHVWRSIPSGDNGWLCSAADVNGSNNQAWAWAVCCTISY